MFLVNSSANGCCGLPCMQRGGRVSMQQAEGYWIQLPLEKGVLQQTTKIQIGWDVDIRLRSILFPPSRSRSTTRGRILHLQTSHCAICTWRKWKMNTAHFLLLSYSSSAKRNQEKWDRRTPPSSNEQKLSRRSDLLSGKQECCGFSHTTTVQTTIASSDLEGSKHIPLDVVVVDEADQVVALLNLKVSRQEMCVKIQFWKMNNMCRLVSLAHIIYERRLVLML